ncbi:MAG: tetratricopeptide repeat protein [Alphaproteobacteria bacterium]
MSGRGAAGAADDGRLHALKRAVRAAANDPARLAALADELARLGMAEPAGRAYTHALSLDPALGVAQHGLGRLRLAAGDAAGALAAFHRALHSEPGDQAARDGLARAFETLGCPLAASACRAPGHAPSPDCLVETARGFSLAGLHDDALATLDRLAPPHGNAAPAQLVRGHALSALGRLDEAAALYRALAAAEPGLAEAWANLGGTLVVLGALDEAEPALRRALALRPGFEAAEQNLANLLIETHRHEEALALLRAMLAREPERAELHHNLANLLLLLGRFEAGWDAYEWRRRVAKGAPPALPLPEWDGEKLNGRPLHVIAEQAPGDAVMFASCLDELAALDGPVHIHCEPRLVALFARSFPFARVDTAMPNGRDDGVAILLGSLPRLFRSRPDAFPAPRAFLTPDEAAVRHWRSRFATLGGALRVGISWRGGKGRVNRRQRTMALEAWLPLLALPGLVAVDLQYGSSADEAESLRQAHGIVLHRFHDEVDPLTDIDGLTAQAAALDLVVSVCNTTVHMSGAVGVPTLALAPHTPSWRWQLDRSDCLWYPGVTLIRQGAAEPWGAVLERVAGQVSHAMARGSFVTGRQFLPGGDAPAPAGIADSTVKAERARRAAEPLLAGRPLVSGISGTDLAP